MNGAESRTCPDCGGSDVTVVHRGLTGPTDEADQFYRCRDCGRVTFEIVSRTARDVRLENITTGTVIRAGGNNYRITRVLKVGLDEFMVYLRPTNEEPRRRPRP